MLGSKNSMRSTMRLYYRELILLQKNFMVETVSPACLAKRNLYEVIEPVVIPVSSAGIYLLKSYSLLLIGGVVMARALRIEYAGDTLC